MSTTFPLRINADKIQHSLNAAKAGTWQWNIANDIFSIDDSFISLFALGGDHGDKNFEDFIELVHFSDRSRVRNAFNNCRETRGAINTRFLIKPAQGTLSLISLRGSFDNTTGEAQQVCGICWDISDTWHNEQLVALAVEAAPNGMVMINESGQIDLVNSKTEEIFGYQRHELIGQSIEMLIPERYRQGHPENRAMFFSQPNTRPMGANRNLFALRKDGSEFPVEIGLNPIETADGMMVLAAVVDITERKKAEERVALAVEAAPNGMIMIDQIGGITLVNSKTEEMFGYQRHELIGQAIELLIPHRFRGEHPNNRSMFFTELNTRPMGANRNLFALRKDGSEFPVEIGLNPIETADGMMVLAAVVDITERKKAEQELEKTNQDLEQFAYVASHDLKAPLRAIEHLANWILEDAGDLLPESSHSDLEMLISRVARMNKLLNGLLEYSRIGRDKSSYVWIDSNTIIDEAKLMLDLGPGFTIHIAGDLPEIFAPRQAMLLVMHNLLGNAVKHHDRPSGNIWISAEQKPSYVEFHIKDDGPGIPSEYHDKIFQMFQTLKPRDVVEGSGLGLALVKKVMENHGGNVTLMPNSGIRGATFVVTWPIYTNDNEQSSTQRE